MQDDTVVLTSKFPTGALTPYSYLKTEMLGLISIIYSDHKLLEAFSTKSLAAAPSLLANCCSDITSNFGIVFDHDKKCHSPPGREIAGIDVTEHYIHGHSSAQLTSTCTFNVRRYCL